MQFPEESWLRLHLNFWYFALQKICVIYYFHQVIKSKQINVFQSRVEDNTGTELRKTAENADTEGSFPYTVLSTLLCHRFLTGGKINLILHCQTLFVIFIFKLYTAGVVAQSFISSKHKFHLVTKDKYMSA